MTDMSEIRIMIPDECMPWGDETVEQLREFFAAIIRERHFARESFQDFHSYHEGLAVILEEYRELEVKVFSRNRQKVDHENIVTECVQLSAMAFCLINEVCPYNPKPAMAGMRQVELSKSTDIDPFLADVEEDNDPRQL